MCPLDGDWPTLTWMVANQLLVTAVEARLRTSRPGWDNTIVLFQLSQGSAGAVRPEEAQEMFGHAQRTWLPFDSATGVGLYDGLKHLVRAMFTAQRAGPLQPFVPNG
jgi:hypothetical protein